MTEVQGRAVEILINGLQATHIAEIAHRQSVGIPAKEWGSIPCFRSNAVQVGSVIEIMVNVRGSSPCVTLVAVNLTAWKDTQIWWYGGIGRRYIAVDITE